MESQPSVQKLWKVISLLVEPHAQELAPGLLQDLLGPEGSLSMRPAGLNHQHHAIHHRAEDPTLWEVVDRRCIHHHVVVAIPHRLEGGLESLPSKSHTRLR